MKNVVIAPSMLSCDFTNISSEIECMESAGADMLHLDVMDGVFVPNITFGMPIIGQMRKHTDIYFDTHLMIDDPEKYIDEFAKAGSNNITVHYEACRDTEKTLKHIRSLGISAALSVKPGTDVEKIYGFLPLCDMVLVMTVEPGFGGQSFMHDMMNKVEKLVKRRNELGLSYKIEVDGGISENTIETASKAGADVFVAGSAVFKSDDRKATIEKLRKLANNI